MEDKFELIKRQVDCYRSQEGVNTEVLAAFDWLISEVTKLRELTWPGPGKEVDTMTMQVIERKE